MNLVGGMADAVGPLGDLELEAENTEDSEYVGGCGGIIRASDPEKFVSMITKSADQLLGTNNNIHYTSIIFILFWIIYIHNNIIDS